MLTGFKLLYLNIHMSIKSKLFINFIYASKYYRTADTLSFILIICGALILQVAVFKKTLDSKVKGL